MLRNLFFLFFVLFGCSMLVLAQSTDADLTKSFSKYHLIKIDTKDSFQKVSEKGKLSIAGFELNLTPRDLRSANYRAEETNANGNRTLEKGFINTYKGIVKGSENSAVRLSISENKIEGFIFANDEKFYVEPAIKYSKSAAKSDYVLYRGEDLLKGEEMSCSVGEKIESGKGVVAKNIEKSNVVIFKVLEVATEADFQYVSSFSGSSTATNNDILATLNMVEGVYEQEMGITLSVTFQHTWTTADPYPNTNASGVLTGFQAYWNANYPMSAVPRDTAHIWTAKSNASAQGIAYFQAVCRTPQDAYGLTGYLDLVPTKYILTAHEIGHNLGANHVDGNQGCADTAMNAILSNLTPFTFCSVSRNEIDGYAAANNSCLSDQLAVPTKFDFDGDKKADIALFRPSSGVWYVSNSSNSVSIFQFGQNGDKVVDEDYDGDGKADAAVYRNGLWFVMRSSTNTFYASSFGNASDIPAPADFDGDGKADLNIFRGNEGNWYRLNSGNGAFSVTSFGSNGDVPLPADYDGDGKSDINLFRPSNGVWYRLNSGNGSFYAAQFGQNGDKPVVGDFDGDGKNDLTVYRNGLWYIYYSSTNNFNAISFGIPTDVPAPADFDGDGKTDVCVYRGGTWFRTNSGNGSFVATQFGSNGDIPAQFK